MYVRKHKMKPTKNIGCEVFFLTPFLAIFPLIIYLIKYLWWLIIPLCICLIFSVDEEKNNDK